MAPRMMNPAASRSLGLRDKSMLGGRSAARETEPLDRILEQRGRIGKVSWGLGYAGLLGYTLAIVTYTLPIAQASMVLALIGVALEPRRIRLPSFIILFGVLLVWGAMGIGSALDPSVSSEAVVEALKLWAIAFVVVNVIRSPAQLRFYIVFLIACFAMYPARGAIFNYYLAGYSVWGRAIWNHAFANPNDLAAFCFLPLSIAWALLVTERKGLFRWGAMASVLVFPLLIFLTQSRGAFLAVLIVGGVALLRQRAKARALFVTAALLVVSLAVVPNAAWERFSGISKLTSAETIAEADPEGSAEARFNIWKTAVLIIKDHPVTGVGLGNYGLAQARYAHMVPGAPEGEKDAHSTYLRMAAELGIPGLAVFLGILLATFRKSRSVRREVQDFAPRQAMQLSFLELGLAGYLVAGLFGSFGMLAFLYLHVAIVFAAADIVHGLCRAEVRAARRVPNRGRRPFLT
jgi:probable O-glycosylation ligase (exosortase A-associated)